MQPSEWKTALRSILIGAVISFITILLQGMIDLLQAIPTQAPGAGGGMAYYLYQIAKTRMG